MIMQEKKAMPCDWVHICSAMLTKYYVKLGVLTLPESKQLNTLTISIQFG